MLITVFSGTDVLDSYIPFEIKAEYAYYFPLAVVAAYFILGVIYYSFLIERRYRKLVR